MDISSLANRKKEAILHTPLERTRALLKDNNIDALLVTDVADLRWLTGAENTFDAEPAHVAFVTPETAHVHTDSRYYQALLDNCAYSCDFTFDKEHDTIETWSAVRISAFSDTARIALQDSAPISFLRALESVLEKKSTLVFLGEEMRDLRAIKTSQEIAFLQEAQDITDKALLYIGDFIQPNMTEKVIRAELEYFMLQSGADALSFDTIIAAGPNGANPHARAGEYQVQYGDLIVIDFGAGKHDYHADMTRTFSVGEPLAEQRAVYEVVRQAHEMAAAALKPGVIGRDIHAIAQRVIADAGYGDYFEHGLGHGVGIEIHENPNLNSRWDKPIPENAVVTVEPGIYLPHKFGIRLEDTGVVTADGFKPFTSINHDLRIIESAFS